MCCKLVCFNLKEYILYFNFKTDSYEVESVQTRRETRRPKKKVIKADSNQNQTISFKFGCEKCKSQFASIASLEAHLKLGHDKVRQIRKKTHQCSLCPKRFRAKNTLNVHMRSHTGERPYQCEVCLNCLSISFCCQYEHSLNLYRCVTKHLRRPAQ